MRKQIELTLKADFAPYLAGRKIVSIDVGPENEVFVTATTPTAKEEALGRYVQPGWASFPLSKVASYRADVLKFAPDFQGETALEIEQAHPFIQPLPNGEILVVAARCRNRDGDPERNAVVYTADRKVARRFVMGDGLSHVSVARDGTIWAGYSDEGVFGNFGWGSFGKEKPVGASGIARFNTQGQILWRFEPSVGCTYIADCYSLNVAPDAVWTCPYMNFPVVRIESNGKKRGWKNEFSGARAIANDQERVLLFGGYTENRSRCVIQDLGKDKMENSREIELVTSSKVNLDRARVECRGSILHLFLKTSWYQFDVVQHDL